MPSSHGLLSLEPAPSAWLWPDWPVPRGVQALCSTRTGGVSAAPWDSLNLGVHVGDAPVAVARNRAHLQQALAGATPVYLHQVHGRAVVRLCADALPPDDHPQADAAVTTEAGLACTIQVADCLPVLLCAGDGTVVGAAHAGWRGLAAGVLEATLVAMAEATGRPLAALAASGLAWLGPCIGPSAFEVGPEVKAAFEVHDPAAAACFVPAPAAGKWRADLAGLARQRLRALGLGAVYGNDGGEGWCTVANPSRFFSHRRDSARLGASGRLAACIWRT